MIYETFLWVGDVMDTAEGFRRIEQKWGFGMARVKPAVQRGRIEAARTVCDILAGNHRGALERLEDISIVKGLYTRTYKKDQWDWFTVWGQLGFPAHRITLQASHALLLLRRSIQGSDATATGQAVAQLVSCDVPGVLERFILGAPERRPNHGFIYILSTREMPTLLKIGYTDRDVVTRAKEINSATGVIVPYGARAVWIVPHAHRVESDIHARLAVFRLRKDREFFQMNFSDAAKIIDAYIATLTE
ncbi:GIY-YIG nuclease family protein [Streptosporangium sp. NPDC049304]|uniref:GIY-YIG nuclease family protein n=1 Tax=Streptosporangium sp. NPDC049304 TaxID=3154830 RepID=UPI00342F8D28